MKKVDFSGNEGKYMEQYPELKKQFAIHGSEMNRFIKN